MSQVKLFESLLSIVMSTITPLQASTSLNLLSYQYQSCVVQESVGANTNLEKEIAFITCIPKKPKNASELTMGGWVPYWEVADATETVQKFGNKMNSISPFWYELRPDGSLLRLKGYMDADLMSTAHTNGIQVTPTIVAFDADIFAQVMESKSNTERLINTIIAEVESTGVDGIDLDFERMYLKNKEQFYAFLTLLKQQLSKIDKQLVFTAHSKWGDEVIYTGYIETRQVIDYGRISKIADELRIMTYEFTGRKSTVYGPNAPIDWVENVLRYALKEGVPREKLVMALPLYSYDYFPVDGKLEEVEYYPRLKVPNKDDQQPAVAYVNRDIKEIKSTYNVFSDEYNNQWGESVLEYQFTDGVRNERRVVVYPSQQSITERKNLLAEYGIKGIYYWRLGDEMGLEL